MTKSVLLTCEKMDIANGFNSLMRNMLMRSCTVSSLVWCLLLFYQTMNNEPFSLPSKLMSLYNKQLYRQFFLALLIMVAALCDEKCSLIHLNTLSVSFSQGFFPVCNDCCFTAAVDNKLTKEILKDGRCRWHQFLSSVSHRLQTRKQQRFPFVLVLSPYNSLSLFLSHPLLLISPRGPLKPH